MVGWLDKIKLLDAFVVSPLPIHATTSCLTYVLSLVLPINHEMTIKMGKSYHIQTNGKNSTFHKKEGIISNMKHP